MKMLAEDIKNGVFKNVYLLCGEEAYLRTQYKNRLRNALSVPGDTMNVAQFEGKGINPREIIDLAETLPFFAERRLILIEDSVLELLIYRLEAVRKEVLARRGRM